LDVVIETDNWQRQPNLHQEAVRIRTSHSISLC